MSIFKPKPERLMDLARSLHLRADELDRHGKHANAHVVRRKARRLEARAGKRP